jgi:spore coat protein U-like protein
LVVLSLAGPPAVAQFPTAQFDVEITITAECIISAAPADLDFGATGVIAADMTGTTTIGVQCTDGTAYEVALDAGIGVGATVANRLMTGPGAATVTYSLYQDAGHTTVWGDTTGGGGNTVTGTGNGAQQDLTVYGLVPAQATPGAGDYTDTITVEVTY